METKKVLWIGGGIAAVFLLAKMLNPRDIIKDEIKKTAEGIKDAFEAFYNIGVEAGVMPAGGTFVKSPFYVLIIESKNGISGTAHVETADSVGSAFDISAPLPLVMIPIPTTMDGKPITKVVFSVNGGKNVSIFADAIPKTNFEEMLSGKADYYMVTA
jgi:hypothetical protein